MIAKKKSCQFSKIPGHLHAGIVAMAMLLLLTTNNSYTQSYQPCHDPSSPLYSDGKWWIFTTGTGIYTMSNSKFTGYLGWTSGSTVFSGSGPSWIQNYVPGFAGSFWAPEIVASGDTFLCYYACSSWGSQYSCIGLATAKALSGPWTDRGVVVYTTSSSSENAIDPFIFKGYLTYGSFFGGIRMALLDSLTGKPADTVRIAVASGDCEASAMTENNGYYYLWINRGNCCQALLSTYHVQVGRSTNITGPFLDKSGVDLNDGGGSDIVTSSGRYIGPGCMGFNAEKAVYHFYDGENNGDPKLMTAKLTYSNDWPVITRNYIPTDINSQEVDQNDANIYPNPFNNQFTLSFDPLTSTEASIEVINTTGSLIYTGKLGNLYSGTNQVNFTTSELNMKRSGLYLIQISTKDKIIRLKLMKE